METSKLISECCKGSITAQKYFFDKYNKQMYLLCRRYMHTNQVAEEIMMNGFFQCFKSLPGFKYNGEAALIAWMKKLFVNECLQVLRKKNNLVIVSDAEAYSVRYEETTLDDLSASEIFTLITKLPVGYKIVFNLYVVEGYNHKEIAAMLRISEGTSKSQLSKARQMLQKMILNNERYYAAKGK